MINPESDTSLEKDNAVDKPNEATTLQIVTDEQLPTCSSEIVAQQTTLPVTLATATNCNELQEAATPVGVNGNEAQQLQTNHTVDIKCQENKATITNPTVGYVQIEQNRPSLDSDCIKGTADLVKSKLDWLPVADTQASSSSNLNATEAAIAAATYSAAAAAHFDMHSKREDMQTQYNGLDFETAPTPSDSMPSLGSLVCRICHNADNPEQLVSPCLCKGSLSYVHIHCLERWIGTSRCTTCELCQFTYNTEQTLRYTCLQSLRLWYSRAMSRRALQEDCQMFSLLTLVAFGIVGTLLVGIQYYALHTQSWGISKLWTKSWMLFFLFMTITVYFANVYMLIKSQLTPWYRWWQSARDIKLILENRRPFRQPVKHTADATSNISMFTHHDMQEMEQQQQQQLQFRGQDAELTEITSPAPVPLPPQMPLMPAAITDSFGTYTELHELHELLIRHPNQLLNQQAAAAATASALDKMSAVDDSVNVTSTTTTSELTNNSTASPTATAAATAALASEAATLTASDQIRIE